MNNPQTLIAALASAPEIIIGLVREVPPQYLKRRPSAPHHTDVPIAGRRSGRIAQC